MMMKTNTRILFWLSVALAVSGCSTIPSIRELIGVADAVRDARGDDETVRPDPTPAPPVPTPEPTTVPTPEPTREPRPPEDRCDGPSGFLWKPESDNNSRLVILLPSSFGDGNRVEIRKNGQNGKLIETGGPNGVANGNREHHRFAHEGAYYERATDGQIFVLVHHPSGGRKGYAIPNGENRCD